MRWLKIGFGVAVVGLLALNLWAQLATQRKLDALAVGPAPVAVPPVVAPPAPVAAASKDHAYVIETPDVLAIDVPGTKIRADGGPFIVRPDGTVGLGEYGNVAVAGLTLADARKKLNEHLANFIPAPTAKVEVLAFNSKKVYVIRRAGKGEQVVALPLKGNETVADAIVSMGVAANISNISIARKTVAPSEGWQVLPVDWVGITQHGVTTTNYQLLPGDRIYLAAK